MFLELAESHAVASSVTFRVFPLNSSPYLRPNSYHDTFPHLSGFFIAHSFSTSHLSFLVSRLSSLVSRLPCLVPRPSSLVSRHSSIVSLSLSPSLFHGLCFEPPHANHQGAVQRMFVQINETLTRGLQASPLVNNRAGALADDISHVRLVKKSLVVACLRISFPPPALICWRFAVFVCRCYMSHFAVHLDVLSRRSFLRRRFRNNIVRWQVQPNMLLERGRVTPGNAL